MGTEALAIVLVPRASRLLVSVLVDAVAEDVVVNRAGDTPHSRTISSALRAMEGETVGTIRIDDVDENMKWLLACSIMNVLISIVAFANPHWTSFACL